MGRVLLGFVTGGALGAVLAGLALVLLSVSTPLPQPNDAPVADPVPAVPSVPAQPQQPGSDPAEPAPAPPTEVTPPMDGASLSQPNTERPVVALPPPEAPAALASDPGQAAPPASGDVEVTLAVQPPPDRDQGPSLNLPLPDAALTPPLALPPVVSSDAPDGAAPPSAQSVAIAIASVPPPARDAAATLDDPLADTAPAPQSVVPPVAVADAPEVLAPLQTSDTGVAEPQVLAGTAPPVLDDPSLAPVAAAEAPPRVDPPLVPPETAPEPANVLAPLPPTTAGPIPTGDAPVLPSLQAASPTLPAREADVVVGSGPAAETVLIIEEPPAVLTLQGDGGLPQGEGAPRVNRPGADAPPQAAEPAPIEAATPRAVFANPDSLPLVALVLLDGGAMPEAVAALNEAGVAITVAIDPTLADAADRAETYRAAGHEIAAILRLPEGATATDAAVTVEAIFTTLPQAVAVLVDGTADLPPQVMSRLAADGRGLIVTGSSLSTLPRRAETLGVPARLVDSDLDSEGQSTAVVGRFLDGAAFRARQGDDGTLLLARVRLETLTALGDWRQGRRAGQVALAPASALFGE